ncbi:MAG: phosphotransferase [Stagnimonas sp.]|nr:phosphotransferase [Stagnimonas sp.]
MTAPALDARAAAAQAFAHRSLGLREAGFAPASADASFRRYFRVEAGGQSWVVMDAPPEREDCRPFLQVAQLMLDAGLNAPKVLAQDLEQGYLLLSDLGRQTFLHVLTEDNADALFADAIAALVQWQQASRAGVLPDYDAALLERELALFPDWYLGRHLDHPLSAEQQACWDATRQLLVDSALAQAPVYVHRDYMPRNLMASAPSPGVLDFQDAVYGPISYDVVSLFKDAFRSWPEARIDAWRQQYWQAARAAGLPVPDDLARFERDFDLMGLQRHLKVLGIFARINYRDGKPHYLADTPRFLGYVRTVAARYPELAPLRQLLDSLPLPA